MKPVLYATYGLHPEIDWRRLEGTETVSIVSGSMISGESVSSGIVMMGTPLMLR
jgi:hypothetical protein